MHDDTDYFILVVGSLVANKHKEFVNSSGNNTSYGPKLSLKRKNTCLKVNNVCD